MNSTTDDATPRAANPGSAARPAAPLAAGSAGSAGATGSAAMEGDRPRTAEMVVVHRAFRREFRLMPRLVGAVAAGDAMRATTVAGHYDFLVETLHHHHTGEDEFVWPLLLERAGPRRAVVLAMEEQHERLNLLVQRADTRMADWHAHPDIPNRAACADALAELAQALDEHLDCEERDALPLVREYLSTAEWAAVGEHGRRAIAPRQAPLFLGLVLEDADAGERDLVLSRLAAPLRACWGLVGERAYRRRIARLRG